MYVGDGHALQADGEPLGTGIETSMDVEFSVTVNKRSGLTGVRVETETHLISVGSQPEFASSLNRGLQMATSDMVLWIASDYGWEDWAAHMLVGMVGVYEWSQSLDPWLYGFQKKNCNNTCTFSNKSSRTTRELFRMQWAYLKSVCTYEVFSSPFGHVVYLDR
ncbi:MAG: hypothetical protein Ct9H300mP19_13950 [Dehalococcoidia bacterium]|nr:MAG: hypothetical protein Ct9H300mP19_13950 [Dehalococcoidia bacterium]